MKRVLFMMLLLGGIALSSQAQRRDFYGPPGHHKHWKKERYYDRGYYGHHGYYRDRRVVVCERPVVYERPVYVAPPPPPLPPVVYYPARPRPHVVIDAGITIVH